MKKFIKIIVIVLLCSIWRNVLAESTTKFVFEEGTDLVSDNSVYFDCAIVSDKAYCLATNSEYGPTIVHEISLANPNTPANGIKTLPDGRIYTRIKKVDNGFIAYAIALGNGIYITSFDNHFNVIGDEFIEANILYSTSDIIKDGSNYYVINKTIRLSDYVAVRVSSDLKNIDLLEASDNLPAIIQDYITYDNSLDANTTLVEFIPFQGGYLCYTYNNNSSSVIFYKDGHEVWNKTEENGYYGTIITKGDKIYITHEKPEQLLTYLVELDKNGEEISRTPITVLNERQRLLYSNYYMGEYNGRYIFLSYKLLDNNTLLGRSNWRVIYMGISSKIDNLNTDIISLDKDNAISGEEVTIIINDKYKNQIEEIIVMTDDNEKIEVKDNKFIMPNKGVKISVKLKDNNKLLVNPLTGNYTSYIFIVIISLITIVFVKSIKKNKI